MYKYDVVGRRRGQRPVGRPPSPCGVLSVNVPLSLSDAQYQMLRQRAAAEHDTMSGVIRRALGINVEMSSSAAIGAKRLMEPPITK